MTTLVSLALLAVLLGRLTPGWANLVAVGVGSVISFELNRRWVWNHTTTSRLLWRKLGFFVSASVAFLALSSLAVSWVAMKVGSRHGAALRPLAIEATTVALFGVRWALQYLLLDGVLFSARVSGQVAVD